MRAALPFFCVVFLVACGGEVPAPISDEPPQPPRQAARPPAPLPPLKQDGPVGCDAEAAPRPLWSWRPPPDHFMPGPVALDEAGNGHWLSCRDRDAPRCVLHSSTRDGTSRFEVPLPPGDQRFLWGGPPVQVFGDRVLVGGAWRDRLHLLDGRDGVLLGTLDHEALFEERARIRQAVAARDGAVHVLLATSDGDHLVTWDAEGRLGGLVALQSHGSFALALDEAGHLYLQRATDYADRVAGVHGVWLESFDVHGRLRWRTNHPATLHIGPAATADGWLLSGSSADELFSSGGALHGSVEVSPYRSGTWPQTGSPLLLGDTAFFAHDGRIEAVDLESREARWRFEGFPTRDDAACSPCVPDWLACTPDEWAACIAEATWMVLTSRPSLVIATGRGERFALQELGLDGRLYRTCPLPEGRYGPWAQVGPERWWVEESGGIDVFELPGLGPAPRGWTTPHGGPGLARQAQSPSVETGESVLVPR